MHFGIAWQPCSESSEELEATRAERDALRQHLAASKSSEELQTTHADRDALRQRLAASASSEASQALVLETTRAERDELRQRLAASESSGELATTRAERDELRQRLALGCPGRLLACRLFCGAVEGGRRRVAPYRHQQPRCSRP